MAAHLKRQHDFFFSPRDYLNDPAVLAMSTLARGAYSTLLFALWDQPEPGVVPSEARALAVLARATPGEWAEVADQVARAFDLETRPGWWIQKRMTREHMRQNRFYATKSRSGKAGRAKQLAGTARAGPGQTPGASSASSASSASPAEERKSGGVSAACLARLRSRFPNLDLAVIEAKMLAHHAEHPFQNLDRAMVGWCSKAEQNGWDERREPEVSLWDRVRKGAAANGPNR